MLKLQLEPSAQHGNRESTNDCGLVATILIETTAAKNRIINTKNNNTSDSNNDDNDSGTQNNITVWNTINSN